MLVREYVFIVIFLVIVVQLMLIGTMIPIIDMLVIPGMLWLSCVGLSLSDLTVNPEVASVTTAITVYCYAIIIIMVAVKSLSEEHFFTILLSAEIAATVILLLVTYPHFDEQYSIDDSAPVTTVHSEDKAITKLNEDNAKQIETEIIKETEIETLSDNSIEILYKNGKSIKEI
ncbi:hypothetical protein DXA57_04235 [Blautia sp. OF03-15BH]|uniref:hypothetical protein n=1 Tax=Blautia sp. OF03-15BH TaxID=2292287 RepID=UPI000E4B448F|nr:hypothetical protein [Blautia sp. OF03-15BH]RGY02479.1 hypothetical protein DXA57_04235 [Blautia sp. OF03-15BH]